MADRVKFLNDGKHEHKEIHFVGIVGSDYTLCGVTLDNDPETFGSHEDTKQKVNCKDCKEIVSYCKSIRTTEITRRNEL